MYTALMRRFVIPVANLLLLVTLVSVAVFLLLELIPGDPIDGLVPPGATEEMRELARQTYGLNEPLAQRYFSWIGGVLQGDFGRSFITQTPVMSLIAERAPVSLELALVSMALALAIAIPLGIWSAYRPGGRVDRISTAVTSATLATPSFVLGILLVFVFGVQLRMFPILGWVPFSEDPVGHVHHLVLPVLTLAAGEAVLFTRLLKGDMMATLQQDHVLSARARGLPTWNILLRHSLRQSSFSLITVSAVVIGRLIGGTVITESIFSVPGMGTLVINSIFSRDFIVVQAVVLLCAVLYLLLNALVDLAYPLLDPRVRKVHAS